MGYTQSSDSFDAMFGQKARNQPSMFGKLIDYGSRMAKVVGSIMEGPAGWMGAADTAVGMTQDKIGGKL